MPATTAERGALPVPFLPGSDPDNPTVRLFHGTGSVAWRKIRRSGFRTSSAKALCSELEAEFGLTSGSVWNHPCNEWSRDRAQHGSRSSVYLTTERSVAVGYAEAGSAPLYDALKAVYLRKYPHRVRRGPLFTEIRGLDGWLVEQVTERAGKPVVLELHLPWEEVHNTWTIHQQEMRTRKLMTPAEFSRWNRGRGREDFEVDIDICVEELHHRIVGSEVLDRPGRIIPRSEVAA